MFSSVSKARIVHLRTQLNRTRKEKRTGHAYFGRIKTLADEMANAEKKLDDEVIISYILAGLDNRYDRFVAEITALIKTEKHVSLIDLYAQFVSYESRIEGWHSDNDHGGFGSDPFVNAAQRGGGYGNRGGYRGGCSGGNYQQGGGHGGGYNGGGRGGAPLYNNGGGNFYSQGGNGNHQQQQQRQGGGGHRGGGSDVVCQNMWQGWTSSVLKVETLQQKFPRTMLEWW
jgi:hypothetical protein